MDAILPNTNTLMLTILVASFSVGFAMYVPRLIADNFYLHYLFFGRYESLSQGPFYLRPQVYETLVRELTVLR